MNNQYGVNHDEVTVEGFELPSSPEASYDNASDFGDDTRDPPPLPAHLQHTLLCHPPTKDSSETLPLPQQVTLNHLYIETKEGPHSAVALGVTHRLQAKSSLLSFIKQAVKTEADIISLDILLPI